jgi:hypothetical protein
MMLRLRARQTLAEKIAWRTAGSNCVPPARKPRKTAPFIRFWPANGLDFWE